MSSSNRGGAAQQTSQAPQHAPATNPPQIPFYNLASTSLHDPSIPLSYLPKKKENGQLITATMESTNGVTKYTATKPAEEKKPPTSSQPSQANSGPAPPASLRPVRQGPVDTNAAPRVSYGPLVFAPPPPPPTAPGDAPESYTYPDPTKPKVYWWEEKR